MGFDVGNQFQGILEPAFFDPGRDDVPKGRAGKPVGGQQLDPRHPLRHFLRDIQQQQAAVVDVLRPDKDHRILAAVMR